MVKIKDKHHHLAIEIKENYAQGMKLKEIANLFHLQKQRVNYWIHHIINKRKRRIKLNSREINMIVRWAKDKPIMKKKVSTKNIQIRFNRLKKNLRKTKRKKEIFINRKQSFK